MSKTVKLEEVIKLIKDSYEIHSYSEEEAIIKRLNALPAQESKDVVSDVKEHLERVRAIYVVQSNNETDELLKNVAYLTAIELSEVIAGLTPHQNN